MAVESIAAISANGVHKCLHVALITSHSSLISLDLAKAFVSTQKANLLWKFAIFNVSCILRGKGQKSRDLGDIAKNRHKS